jgi:hypothetical protein
MVQGSMAVCVALIDVLRRVFAHDGLSWWGFLDVAVASKRQEREHERVFDP